MEDQKSEIVRKPQSEEGQTTSGNRTITPLIPFDLKKWKEFEQVATKIKESEAFPPTIDNIPKIMMAMQKGFEMGMGPMESLDAFYYVNGRLTIFGEAGAKMIKRHGYHIQVPERTDERCTIRLISPDEKYYHEQSFTIQEARKARLVPKPGSKNDGISNWSRYPRDMLFWKALARARKAFCPEVLSGTPFKEDLEDDLKLQTQWEKEQKQIDKELEEKRAAKNVLNPVIIKKISPSTPKKDAIPIQKQIQK